MMQAVGDHAIDGMDAGALAVALMLPRVVLSQRVSSTMDEAHRLGSEGAHGGTLIIADEQTSGRGRRVGTRRAFAPPRPACRVSP
jgi:hypothetical protein